MDGKAIAVQFGAGQIGRGFTGALFHESGLRVVFVEAVQSVVDRLHATHEYTLHIVGEEAADYRIDGVEALHISETDPIVDALAQAVVACTAVGVQAMTAVAPLIAQGVAHRARVGNQTPINILICENQLGADEILRAAVRDHLSSEFHGFFAENVGFVLCVVSRMVPIATEEERETLEVRAEKYKRLPVDKAAIKGELPAIVGVLPVENFEGYIERKLFVHNASHAILGYFGALKGYEFGWQALEDPAIREAIVAAIEPSLEALSRKHGFDRAEMDAHLEDLLKRYSNRELGDTTFRLARDPLRKLRPDDRLVGAALLAESYDLPTDGLCRAIAAALKFDDERDPSSQQLQQMIREKGIEQTLIEWCGLSSETKLYHQVLKHYQSA